MELGWKPYKIFSSLEWPYLSYMEPYVVKQTDSEAVLFVTKARTSETEGLRVPAVRLTSCQNFSKLLSLLNRRFFLRNSADVIQLCEH